MASGWAPVNSSTTFPSLKNFTEGIDIIPYLLAWVWFFSVSAFAKISLPSYSIAIFSKTGPSIIHGPHQLAQKSTRTGIVFDFSITSFSKVSSVTLSSIVLINIYFL